MKTTFKQLFEKSYGEGSFNDDFLIDALSAAHLAEKYADSQNSECEGSFSHENFVMVNCSKCEEPYSHDGESSCCFGSKEEAIEAVTSYGWEIKGDVATCEGCILESGLLAKEGAIQ